MQIVAYFFVILARFLWRKMMYISLQKDGIMPEVIYLPS